MGLRLRLRARPRPTAARRYTSLAVGRTATRRPASVEPERRTAARRSTATASPARAAPTRRARAADRTASPATTPTRGFLDDSYDLVDAAPGKSTRAPLLVRDRPGPRPAGLVHRRPRRSRPATTVLYSSDFEYGRRRPARLQRRLPGATSATAAPCTDGWQYVDAPVEVAAPTTPTTWSCATAPASTSTARARTTATPIGFQPGLLARLHRRGPRLRQRRRPTTRRRRRRSTPRREPGERRRRTSTTRRSPRRPGATRSRDTGAGHVDNYAGPDDRRRRQLALRLRLPRRSTCRR